MRGGISKEEVLISIFRAPPANTGTGEPALSPTTSSDTAMAQLPDSQWSITLAIRTSAGTGDHLSLYLINPPIFIIY
jgi:hypothetical protein